jgi:hypothetical protein
MRGTPKLSRSAILPRCPHEISRIFLKWGMLLNPLEIGRARPELITRNSSKVWRSLSLHLIIIIHQTFLSKQIPFYLLRLKLQQWPLPQWWWWQQRFNKIQEVTLPPNSLALNALLPMNPLRWQQARRSLGLSHRLCKDLLLWSTTSIRSKSKISFLGQWAETLTMAVTGAANRNRERQPLLPMWSKASRTPQHP